MATQLTRHFFCGGNCTSEKYPNPATFVKLLTGSDNTADYSYLGMLNEQTGEVRLTAKSCAGADSWAVRIVRRVLAQMWEGEGMQAILAAGWDVHHEGRCGRCGRPLTVPESLEVGIGPDCAEQMGIPYPTRSKPAKARKRKGGLSEEDAALERSISESIGRAEEQFGK